MSRNQILVPSHVVEREAIERANREVEDRKQQHRQAIVTLKASLKSSVECCPLVKQHRNTDERAAIRQLCQSLIHYSRFSLLQLTPKEIGFLVSDVLLGEGVGYEEKT